MLRTSGHRPRNEPREVPFVLTFADLIYALIIAAGIPYLSQLIESKDHLSLLLLSFVFLLIFDDWYGEHFYGKNIAAIIGNLWFYSDILVFFIFYFYEYLSIIKSIFLLIAMVINGIRGLILDYLCLCSFSKKSFEYTLTRISLEYAILFIITYLFFFLMAFFWFRIYFLNEILVFIIIGLWILLRSFEYNLKRIYSKKIRVRN